MSNKADNAARKLRTEVEGNGPALIFLDDIRAVLDDRERLIGELRAAQEKLDAQRSGFAVKEPDAVSAHISKLSQELHRIARQQVDDSDDHEARLLRLERLHGLQG